MLPVSAQLFWRLYALGVVLAVLDRYGVRIVYGTFPKASAETVACMKFHLAFVKSGFRSFFADVPEYRTTLHQIHVKFYNYVKQSVATYELKF